MQIVEKKLTELTPYGRNPRKNAAAVDPVAESIKSFGFRVPLVVTSDGEIVAGHTRLKAAEKLGMETVPCVLADDLTPEQIKAFRLADNKVGEIATWIPELLAEELKEICSIDMTAFSFDSAELLRRATEGADWFQNRKRYDNDGIDEEDEEYKEFVEKYKIKKTSDDCYTPDPIFDAVAGWVEKEYKVKKQNFVRPFYPGGDYAAREYKRQEIVVDNPPFSILSEILKHYNERGIRYFLFAPSLTLFSSAASKATAIVAYADITYENGATIKTSFLTNMENEEIRARTAPDLTRAVIETNKALLREKHRELPKYEYPAEVLTSAMMGQWSFYGIDYRLLKQDSEHIRALDEQKKHGKAIFGSAFLISKKAAAEKAAAEKAAAEKAAAEKWRLSRREKQIVKSLGEKAQLLDDKKPMEKKDHSSV